jgi:hypothetical protein
MSKPARGGRPEQHHGVGREFAMDQEALDTAMAEINTEDIEASIASPPDQPTP